MPNFIDARFGVFPTALGVYEKRAELIAGNLINEHTPHYKAQDLDFKAIFAELQQNQQAQGYSDKHTNTVSNTDSMPDLFDHLRYRTVSQSSPDGNTVDGQIEQAEFADNSLRYLATLNFLGSRVKDLMLAIKGTA